jgi:anaerobic selenocysteine-containing dehydrogenase
MHTSDCDELGLESGDWAALRNPRGQIEVTVRKSPLISAGMVYVPIHHPGANPNVLRDRTKREDRVNVAKVEGRDCEAFRPKVAIAEVGAWTP